MVVSSVMVQFSDKKSLCCLYASSEDEWVPSDGNQQIAEQLLEQETSPEEAENAEKANIMTKNRYKRYLASNMSIRFLHKEYNKRHPDSQVKYGIFYRIFTEDYDICTYCAKNNADLNSAKLKKYDALIKELTTSKELHLRPAHVFFDLLKSKKENPVNNELIICFDFEKNLPLPVTNISDEYYKRQLWLHNLGINDVLSNQATMFLFTENFAHKRPNKVLTALEYYIKPHYASSEDEWVPSDGDQQIAEQLLEQETSPEEAENAEKGNIIIFTEDYNFSFTHPRNDISTYCAKNNADLNSAKLKKDDALIKELTTSKELHLRPAHVFFDLLKSKKENPVNNELVICFDFEKNLPLPVTNISDEYYKRQLWLHNLGINDVLSNQATMFLFTKNFAHKRPKKVLAALEYYIKIVNYYPIPGHSMMPIGRCFAAIEKKRLKEEKIDTPDSYIKMIIDSRSKNPFEIVFLQHTVLTKFSDISKKYKVLKVKDSKKAYSSKIKAIPGISNCRRILYCFSLYKAGHSRIISNVLSLEEAYKRFIKLKQEKLENIKFFLGHTEVKENREFYKLLDEESSEVDNKIEDDANSETDDFE
ncbi:hypothetical protein ILUMI_03858 [Ignelater luminosus]|uniref:Uncharacterized protein n=1 Tax=Ignelater luminosus TaxID=2038154 RepID=A0A8K0DDQ0_IGNLU|nr:hypothetical protein ILUMI_03858 [Ignelater luminosus]